jgi:hypothetical protein
VRRKPAIPRVRACRWPEHILQGQALTMQAILARQEIQTGPCSRASSRALVPALRRRSRRLDIVCAGKTLKRELRRPYWQGHDRQDG